MSANLKCYDGESGQVLFDLSSNTSRLLAVFGSDVNEKTHTFSDDEMGGGSLFWYTADPVRYKITMINRDRATVAHYQDLSVSVSGNQIYFRKHQDITLFVGVKV